MNTSTFMDKQIMDLTAAGKAQTASPKSTINNNSISDHRQPDENDDSVSNDHNQPSYDFQPIRPIQSTTTSVGVSRVSNSITPSPPPIKKYGSLEINESTKGISKMDRNAHDDSILSEIDRTVKKYSENLMHALEGVSARLTQLETRTRNLENLVDDLNVAVGNNHGSTDGKMRHLENILREVQTGVQVLRDKHEIIEAQLELSKLQVSHVKQQPENLNAAGSNSVPQTISAPLQEAAPQQQVSSAPQQGYQQLPSPTLQPFPMPQNAVAPAPQSQSLVPHHQMPNQLPQNQVPHPAQYPPHVQTQETPNQHYQHTPTQPPPPPPHPSSAPLQQYPGSYPPYSQPPQQMLSMPPVSPPQGPPPMNIPQEEAPYIPAQSYGPPLNQPRSHPPSAGAQPQQYYGSPSQLYDLPPPRSNMGYAPPPPAYNAPSGHNEPYPYGGSAQYGSGSKPQQTSSSGSGYPQLPTARILPQAIPTAAPVSGGSGPGGASSNNRVPVDDVIDKVSSMGFSREQVRATVRRLTENGQSVDLNIVLDKLMNG